MIATIPNPDLFAHLSFTDEEEDAANPDPGNGFFYAVLVVLALFFLALLAHG